MIRKNKLFILRLERACLLLMLAAAFSASANRPAFAEHGGRASTVPRHAPNFVRMDLDHRKVDLSAYRGKVVLLNFWATWCGPCLTEMPRFVEWQQRYGSQRFQVLSVSMDDTVAPVRSVNAKLKLNYPVVMGDEKLGTAYGGILGLPVTFVIDTDGRIRATYQGVADLPSIEHEIQTLLPRK